MTLHIFLLPAGQDVSCTGCQMRAQHPCGRHGRLARAYDRSGVTADGAHLRPATCHVLSTNVCFTTSGGDLCWGSTPRATGCRAVIPVLSVAFACPLQSRPVSSSPSVVLKGGQTDLRGCTCFRVGDPHMNLPSVVASTCCPGVRQYQTDRSRQIPCLLCPRTDMLCEDDAFCAGRGRCVQGCGCCMPSLQPPDPSGQRGVGCGPQQPWMHFAIGLGTSHVTLPSFNAPTSAAHVSVLYTAHSDVSLLRRDSSKRGRGSWRAGSLAPARRRRAGRRTSSATTATARVPTRR